MFFSNLELSGLDGPGDAGDPPLEGGGEDILAEVALAPLQVGLENSKLLIDLFIFMWEFVFFSLTWSQWQTVLMREMPLVSPVKARLTRWTKPSSLSTKRAWVNMVLKQVPAKRKK